MPMFSKDAVPKSICILRLSALGDVTHVLPALNAIKKTYPDAEITWICGSVEHKLVSAIPGIRFIVFNKNEGLKAYWKLRKELQGQRFDVLLLMQVSARANVLSLLINSGIRLGWDRASSRDMHQHFINQRIESGCKRHQVQSFLAFARAIGAPAERVEWAFPVSRQAYQFADEHVDQARNTLLISPCSSHILRNWLPERYAAVADYAIEKLDMQVILSGGPSDTERKMGEKIQQLMQHKTLNLIGKDTLQQLMALLERVDVVIAPDTGPAHMANAVGTKVIGLYACTNSQRSGPYGSLNYCVDKFSEAAEKFLNRPSDELRWGTKIERPGVMELITVDDVVAKLKALF